MSANPLDAIVGRLGELPALPQTAAAVLRSTDDPMCDASTVAQAIEQDPALAAKILQVSNSPYYGMRQFVGTLKLALVVVGVREVRNIVTGVAVFDALAAPGGAALMTGLWEHSMRVGGVARQLGTRLQAGVPGEAFLAGLLHDIGKLALARHDAPAYVGMAGAHGEALCNAERESFGFTHAEAGAALAEHWHFPLPLVDAIRYHHVADGAPLAAARDPALAAIVRIANLAARAALTVDGDTSPACADDEAWGVLANCADHGETNDRAAVLKSISTGPNTAPGEER